jgi:hypothetical protein
VNFRSIVERLAECAPFTQTHRYWENTVQSQLSETQLFEVLFCQSQCAEFEVITVLDAEFRWSVYLCVNMLFSGITVLSYSVFFLCYWVLLYGLSSNVKQ